MTRRPDPDTRPRETGHDLPMPPTGLATRRCVTCTAHYLDTPIGRDAHKTVFGHQPTAPDGG